MTDSDWYSKGGEWKCPDCMIQCKATELTCWKCGYTQPAQRKKHARSSVRLCECGKPTIGPSIPYCDMCTPDAKENLKMLEEWAKSKGRK